MADINGKDYLFQTIRWEDLIVFLNWEDNMNNIKKIMSPYFDFDYVDAGGRVNGYPFYFDAINHKLEIPSGNHVYIRKKGIYSLVMSNGKNGGKTPIELSEDGIDLTNTRLDLHEFNPGMSRFDLYLYDSSRVYVASDFENLIESEPSSKGKPYDEKGYSKLIDLNKKGTGLGADMTYCAADNFSFKKDGNIYNMQGWSTDNRPNDKGLTATQIEDENVDPPYGYNVSGIETKQFNLGLYPQKVIFDWTSNPISISRHTEGDVIACNGESYLAKKDERVIVYKRNPMTITLGIDTQIDWLTSSWDEISRDNGYFNSIFEWSYTSPGADGSVEVDKDSWDKNRTDKTRDQYFLKILEKYLFYMGEFNSWSNKATGDGHDTGCSKTHKDLKLKKNQATYLDFNTKSFNWYNKILLTSSEQTGYSNTATTTQYFYYANIDDEGKPYNISPDTFTFNCCNCKIEFPEKTTTETDTDFLDNNLSESFKKIFNVQSVNYGYGAWKEDSSIFVVGVECGSQSGWNNLNLYYYFKFLSETGPQYSAVLWSPYMNDKVMTALYYIEDDYEYRRTVYNNSDYDIEIKYHPQGWGEKFELVLIPAHSNKEVVVEFYFQDITYKDPVLNRTAIVIEYSEPIIEKSPLSTTGVTYYLKNNTETDIEIDFFDGRSTYSMVLPASAEKTCIAPIETYSSSSFSFYDAITGTNKTLNYNDIPLKTQ